MDSKIILHAKWKCRYHIVFIPKYRKKQLYERLREDVKNTFDEIKHIFTDEWEAYND